MAVRNFLYQTGVFTTYRFSIPIIAVGNLSVGGTGKTPQIEALIRYLQPRYRLATLSRGYGRKSKGFHCANDYNPSEVNGSLLGDEPLQIHLKFPSVTVAVDADRRQGITRLLQHSLQPEIILLDDAFQHRRVNAGLYILLTAYNDLFCDDWMLPTGTLREFTSGKKRAHLVIVTKCPPDINAASQQSIIQKLQVDVPVYFSTIRYENTVTDGAQLIGVETIRSSPKVLLAGIAKPKPFFNFLQREGDSILTFPDHHDFSDQDIAQINSIANGLPIITTEKDFVRLRDKGIQAPLYYLPMTSSLLKDESLFFHHIQQFIDSFPRT